MSELGTRMRVARRAVAGALMSMTVTMPLVMIGGGDLAWAAGDGDAGLVLARKWCSGCHVVEGSGDGTDTVPSFQRIARKRGEDQTWLKAWLMTPHPPMPDFNLSREQIDDIGAYISSLARP